MSGDMIFADRKYRKMGGSWMVQPATLRGFIAVAEESTIAMLSEIERLRAELAAWQGTVRAHEALAVESADEIERLRKRLQACQSNDDYALTDDVITQNERWLLADNERLRNQRRELIDAFRIVVRDWCPSSVKVPVLDACEGGTQPDDAPQEARRER